MRHGTWPRGIFTILNTLMAIAADALTEGKKLKQKIGINHERLLFYLTDYLKILKLILE